PPLNPPKCQRQEFGGKLLTSPKFDRFLSHLGEAGWGQSFPTTFECSLIMSNCITLFFPFCGLDIGDNLRT
ncbi:MAG: hypothetical protein DRI56_08785, partial [Chloroflexota bacterium]